MESEIDIEEEYNLSDEYVDDPSEHYETETWFETPADDLSDDAFYLNLSVAVVEAESDEIDAEFVEAVTEIEGKKSFPCPKCTKICKSKGSLTRHTNSKHRENDSSSSISEQETHLSEENFVSIVKAIKTKLIKDDLFGHEINDALKNVSSSKALFQAVTPIYNMFCRKQNRDKLLEEFYGLLPT
ncbi:Serologically defined colon cancer antigen 8-like, partial [Paramuricea clavata]